MLLALYEIIKEINLPSNKMKSIGDNQVK